MQMSSVDVGLPPNGSILEGKWCLVTGASRGVGWKMAEAFASEKANLILVARSEGPLKEVRYPFLHRSFSLKNI